MDDCRFCRSDGLNRRDFLQAGAGSVAAMLFANYSRLALGQDRRSLSKAKAKSCIVLWMGGGPSHIDTFDPKPGRETGGPWKALDTTAKGIRVSEHLPRVAGQMKYISVVRSMSHREGAHQRATFLLQTGHPLNPAIDYPGSGAIVSSEVGETLDIPNYVAIAGGAHGPGFLGVEHFPYTISNPAGALRELQAAAKGVKKASLLAELNKHFDESHPSPNNLKRKEFVEKVRKLVDSKFADAIDLDKEPADLKKAYGENRFGQGCLMARRLVETGVKFIQVNQGGWDTHQDNFNRTKRNLDVVDPAFSTLVRDLEDRGMLESTLVVWMGEFGRTPRINGNEGRDHYPRAFSVALAGGGVKGGRVIGATDEAGAKVVKDQASVGDLLATIYGQFGIDLDKRYYHPKTGVVKITEDGKPLRGLTS